jgi:hypothetical protein
MRMSQRQKQRILEEAEEAHGSLAPRSNFCPVCKLNYRQLKSKHQASESHRVGFSLHMAWIYGML